MTDIPTLEKCAREMFEAEPHRHPAAPAASDIAKQIKCITCGEYFDTTSAGVCFGCIKSFRRAEQVEAALPASNAASDAEVERVARALHDHEDRHGKD